MATTMTNTPTIGTKVDSLLDQIESLMDQIWDARMYDTPDEIAEDVTNLAHKWKAGFEDICFCKRPIRYCAC